MPQIRHSVCSLDCPDCCSVLVTVQDGRATKLRGNPDHPVTRGFLCGKVAQYLEREYHPDRLLYPQRRTGRQGRRPLRTHLLGRCAGHHRRTPARRRARVRPRGHPALQLRRQHGAAQQCRHGPPLLPPAGRVAARPHHLFLGRRRRADPGARLPLRHRARAVPPRKADPGLGRQYPRNQRAPVALHRGGAAQRRQVLRDRPQSQSHRQRQRPPLLHQSGQRYGARSRHDARHHRRRAGRLRLRRAPHRRLRPPARARQAVDPAARRRAHRHSPPKTSPPWRANTPPPAPP